MVSIGDNEIFPLMKCVNIFDLTTEPLPNYTSTASLSFVASSSTAPIGKHLLGVLAPEKNHVLCHRNGSIAQALFLHHQLKPLSNCSHQMIPCHLSLFSSIYPPYVPYQNNTHILPHKSLSYVVDRI